MFANFVLGIALLLPQAKAESPFSPPFSFMGQKPNLKTPYCADGAVYDTLATSSSFYFAGAFEYVGVCTGSGVMIKTSDSTSALTWDKIAHVDGPIKVVKSDGAGGWYIGGSFNYVGGQIRQNFAHILSDGRLNISISANTDGPVNDILVTTDRVYLAGRFSSVDFFSRQNLAAISLSTGLIDSLWAPPALNAQVRELTTDGSNLYFVGDFNSIGGAPTFGLAAVGLTTAARLTSWNPIVSFPYITTMGVVSYFGGPRTIASDGNLIYVGGLWLDLAGSGPGGVAALNKTTGAFAFNFNLALSGEPASVNKIATDGGQLYVSGAFDQAQGQARNGLAAFNLSNGLLATWNPTPANLVNNLGGGHVLNFGFSNNSVYLVGAFTSINGASRKGFAEVDKLSGALKSMASPVNTEYLWINFYGDVFLNAPSGSPIGSEYLLAATPDNYNNPSRLFVGGNISFVNGSRRYNIAEIDINTNQLKSFSPNLQPKVNQMAISPKGVFVAGVTSVNGVARTGVAEVDRSTAEATSWNAGVINQNVATLYRDGSKFYIGGDFNLNYGGAPRFAIARFDLSTTPYTLDPWYPSLNGKVNAIESTGTSIYLAGFFSSPTSGLVALEKSNGSVVTGWNAPAVNGGINSLAFAPSINRLFLGGEFTQVSGQNRTGLASISLSGVLDNSFNPNLVRDLNLYLPNVISLLIIESNLYLSGFFDKVNSAARPGFAQVNLSNGSLGPLSATTDMTYFLNFGHLRNYANRVVIPEATAQGKRRTAGAVLNVGSGTVSP